jgi:hypothetical protein
MRKSLALVHYFAHKDHSLHLDISPPATSWLAQFWLRLGDKTGEVDLTYEVQINGIWEVLDDTIQLEATCPSYGGRRWWFRCPVTGRRAAKLYLFPEQRRFCHRTGIDPAPTYQSQRVSGAHRVYCRLYNLRQRLPDQGSILETLRRPRGMHVKTYFRLLQRDAEIWNSPQNTLVKWFKQSGSSSALDDFPGGFRLSDGALRLPTCFLASILHLRSTTCIRSCEGIPSREQARTGTTLVP